MMFNILICDDEKHITDEILSYVKSYFYNHNIQYNRIIVFNDVNNALMIKEKVDLAFLDIEIGKENGFELADSLLKKHRKTMFVFITNYDCYFINAFHIHAFDYILKPPTQKEIDKVLDDFINLKGLLLENDIIKIFKTKNRPYKIKLSDIIYFETSMRKVYLTSSKNCIQIIADFQNIKKEFEQLNFQSPHKSFMANLSKVSEIKGYNIYMDNGDIIPLSQKKSAIFRHMLFDYYSSYEINKDEKP